MDILDAFKYPFKDSGWIGKVIKMILFSLLCVTIPIVLGYNLKVARRAAVDPEGPMPEFDNFGELFSQGFTVLALYLAYILPGLAVAIIPMVLLSSGDNVSVLGMAFTFIGYGLVFIAALVAQIGYLFVMRDGNISSGFNISEILGAFTSNFGSVALFLVFAFIINLISNTVGSLLFGVGTIVTGPLAMLCTAALYGQLARKLEIMPQAY